MTRQMMGVFFRFYIEWTFVALLLLFSHFFTSQPMPLAESMIIAGAGSLIFIYLLEKKRDKGKLIAVLALFPGVFAAGWFAGLQVFYLFVLLLFLFWRTLFHFQSPDSGSVSGWLALTFLGGLCFIPLAQFGGNIVSGQVTFLLVFQLIFILTGQFLYRWTGIKDAGRKYFAYDFLKLLAVSFAFITIASLGKDILKQLFSSFTTGLSWVFAYLAYPVFYLLDVIISDQPASSYQPESKKPDLPEEIRPQAGTELDYLGPILLAAAGILLFYYLYKKANLSWVTQSEEETGGQEYKMFERIHAGTRSLATRQRFSMPEAAIRKEVFKLEKFAHKKGVGRKNHETLDQWLDRQGIDYDRKLVNAYEDVRYGGCAEKEPGEWMIKEINSIRKQLLRIKKEKKKQMDKE